MSPPILPSAPPATNPEIERLQGRVDTAAFALLREGRNPTIASIRARLGGASPNLVAPALQRWRWSFAAQLDANAGSALEVLPPGVLELVQALWSRALFEAHRVRDDVSGGADRLEGLNKLLGEVRALTARLQAREATLDEQMRDLEAKQRRLEATGAVVAVRPVAKGRKPKPDRLRKVQPRALPRRGRGAKPSRRSAKRKAR